MALTAIQAIVDQIQISEAKDRSSALDEISRAKEILFRSRETEPFMRNAIRYMEWRVRMSEWRTVEELRELIKDVSDEFLKDLNGARRRIAEIGSKRIKPGDLIFTHCHSSAVNEVLKLAKKRGVDFEVICTETRPVYQGRITAEELLESGVRTTMIVDSAVRYFMNRVNLALVGADAITSEGNVINKIGTSLFALAAREARTPLYVVTELLKFDPETIQGEYEAIEERPTDEVWPDAPYGLNIRNPAFDITRRDYIHGIICEEGVISPHSILEAVRRRYPWTLELSG